MGPMVSGIRVIASFQIFTLRMYLHPVGVASVRIFSGGNHWGNISRGGCLWNHSLVYINYSSHNKTVLRICQTS